MLSSKEIKDIESLIKKALQRPSTEELLYFVVTELDIFNTLKKIYCISEEDSAAKKKVIASIASKSGLNYRHFESEILKILGVFNPSSDKADFYSKLGLKPGAGMDEVKKRFRELSLKYHPDKAGPQNASKFIEICEAYNAILKNDAIIIGNKPWIYKSEDASHHKKRNRMASGGLWIIAFSILTLMIVSIVLIELHDEKTLETRLAQVNEIKKKSAPKPLQPAHPSTPHSDVTVAKKVRTNDVTDAKKAKEKQSKPKTLQAELFHPASHPSKGALTPLKPSKPTDEKVILASRSDLSSKTSISKKTEPKPSQLSQPAKPSSEASAMKKAQPKAVSSLKQAEEKTLSPSKPYSEVKVVNKAKPNDITSDKKVEVKPLEPITALTDDKKRTSKPDTQKLIIENKQAQTSKASVLDKSTKPQLQSTPQASQVNVLLVEDKGEKKLLKLAKKKPNLTSKQEISPQIQELAKFSKGEMITAKTNISDPLKTDKYLTEVKETQKMPSKPADKKVIPVSKSAMPIASLNSDKSVLRPSDSEASLSPSEVRLVKEIQPDDVTDIKKSEVKTTDKDINVQLNEFLKKYISLYEQKNFSKFATVFTQTAQENGKPFYQMREQYIKLFNSLDSIDFSIFNYSLLPQDNKIILKGSFKTSLLYKDAKKKRFTGKISLTIVRKGISFLVEELSYNFDLKLFLGPIQFFRIFKGIDPHFSASWEFLFKDGLKEL